GGRPMSAAPAPRRPHLLVLSADTSDGLERETDDLAATLLTGVEPADLAAKLLALPPLTHRRAVVAADPVKTAQHLQHRDSRFVITGHAGPSRPVVFLFAGVGDQYAGLGAGLARALPVFRDELLRSLRAMEPEAGVALTRVLFPADGA